MIRKTGSQSILIVAKQLGYVAGCRALASSAYQVIALLPSQAVRVNKLGQ